MTLKRQSAQTHPDNRWAITHAHARAVLVFAVAALTAVLAQRPDILLLGVPVGLIALWSVLSRPREVPSTRLVVPTGHLREGAWSRAVVGVSATPDTELVSTSLTHGTHIELDPERGARSHLVSSNDLEGQEIHVVTRVRAGRWGLRRIGPALVGATSPWGAFRWGPVPIEHQNIKVLPDPAVFDTSSPAPHPQGLVGQHRSRRPGEGSEFNTIRRFQWGDRLKRIHWGRSLRTGDLHVTSSFADQDTHVHIIVDAHYDLGASDHKEGLASSLDYSVRSAAAVAEHFLHQGDRVGLQVLSARTPLTLAPGSGRRHTQRVLEVLSLIQAQPQEQIDPRRLRHGVGPGALVVMISSLVSPAALAAAALLSHSGVQVVVIDALVDDVKPPGEQDDIAALAWRIRLIEREAEIRRVQTSGVPVVAWHGPGSLDQVLRSLARHRHGAAR
ncbi:DUF58 domain-containing protein [Ornithinimicrobium faecis]|uniref:DUF58 domain-containing protein n=1 Tax=Ornithinimicrobium faecis TaxID=2934158 RepID=A0ABY4YQH3_9MICO|nr:MULTISPECIES: DUF58 domain-containing protein [unclassified Ornithinimicrobium]USQ78944.1 DUF58 domain-containing protein [Ornithinimicrobium sp. HY1793]